MNRIHIVGRKNHGKTTFVRQLITEIDGRGLRVGSIKHSGHHHELDRVGSDSHGHREAGAQPAAIVAQGLTAVFLPRQADDDPFARLEPLYSGCDLVLVEGGHHYSGAPKIEIWRAQIGSACLANQHDDILAVISDDLPEVQVPIWPRSPAEVADHILELTGLA